MIDLRLSVMFKRIKHLLLRVIGLGLILASHLGLLAHVFGLNWIYIFYSPYQTVVLLSVLILIVIYTATFILFRYSRPAYQKICTAVLFLMVIAGLISVVYVIFLAETRIFQISASTVLFAGVSFLVAWCDANTESIVWKNLYRITMTILLISFLNLLYIPQDFIRGIIFSFEDTMDIRGEKKFGKKELDIGTSFYAINATDYHLSNYYLPRKFSNMPSHIGALDDKNFLVIDRFGAIYHLALKQQNEDEDLYIRQLSAVFPINYQTLYSSEPGKRIVKNRFRVNDLFIDTENGQKTLYVSHHFYYAEKECIAIRVSKLVGDISLLLTNNAEPQWHVLYEAPSCFYIGGKHVKFGGQRSGGRIVKLDDDHILFSVGDVGDLDVTRPQDPNTAYGKIWKINRHDGTAELFSIGHRNPQGLYRTPDGSIWNTEHGPAGGDELNKVRQGRNYGWPHVVYGRLYGSRVWLRSPKQDAHEGYEQPVFAWNPSIGVSNLIRVEKDLFPIWKHDLLVGSLGKQTLFRLQMHKDRVIYSEPIKIGHRIRDLTETPNGEIFIWSDRQSLIRLRPATIEERKNESLSQYGKRLFSRQCSGCHSIARNASHGIGTNLKSVYKSRIARHSDFDYSPGLRAKSAERWTEENLDLFLKDAQSFAPGTLMQIKISDDRKRQALIEYLSEH